MKGTARGTGDTSTDAGTREHIDAQKHRHTDTPPRENQPPPLVHHAQRRQQPSASMSIEMRGGRSPICTSAPRPTARLPSARISSMRLKLDRMLKTRQQLLPKSLPLKSRLRPAPSAASTLPLRPPALMVSKLRASTVKSSLGRQSLIKNLRGYLTEQRPT